MLEEELIGLIKTTGREKDYELVEKVIRSISSEFPNILNLMHEVAKRLSEHYNVVVNVELVDD